MEQVKKHAGTFVTVALAVLVVTNFIQPAINKAKISSPSAE